jgi:hypothetical protein
MRKEVISMRLIRKPFKGSFAYEWQILGAVLQLFFPNRLTRNKRYYIGVWWDKDWYKPHKWALQYRSRLIIWLVKHFGTVDEEYYGYERGAGWLGPISYVMWPSQDILFKVWRWEWLD